MGFWGALLELCHEHVSSQGSIFLAAAMLQQHSMFVSLGRGMMPPIGSSLLCSNGRGPAFFVVYAPDAPMLWVRNCMLRYKGLQTLTGFMQPDPSPWLLVSVLEMRGNELNSFEWTVVCMCGLSNVQGRCKQPGRAGQYLLVARSD